jgi:flagellin
MDSIESIYTELTALAADSASDNPSQPRASLNARFNELRNEVTNIVNGAVYNGVAVLDGTYSSAFGGNDLSVMYSVDITQRLSLPIDKISTSGLGLDPLNISTQVGAISAYSSLTDSFTIGTALQRLNTRQYNFAQIKNIIEIHTNHINVQATNYESAASSLTEADVPLEVARQTALEVKKQSATAMIAQSNLSSQNIVNLINKVFMSN